MKNTVYFIAFIFLFFFLVFLFVGTEKCHAGTNPPSLKYLGNAFVKIKTSEGKVIFIDPYAVTDPDSADIVLVTHEHSDHNDLTRVIQKPTCKVIRAADAIRDSIYQTFTIGNVKVVAVPAYNAFHPKYTGVGFVVEFDSIRIYHAGGTGKIPEMADLASRKITYALLPMTPGPEEMTQAAAMIQAKYDIPIHTIVSPDLSYDNALVARFTSPHKLIMLPYQTIDLTNATTIHISSVLRVPQEYSTIQAAIDASKNWDTVLVSEGRYFENIRFKGKGIVLTSRYSITKDWQAVLNTVIDGSTATDKNNASTVQFLDAEDSTTVLDGFTITGGTGTRWNFSGNIAQEGGGILLAYSSATIRNNIITNNMTRNSAGSITGGGGGISSLYGNPTIYNNTIFSNTSGYAGGIVLNWSRGKVRNNIIYHNSINGQWGGGGMMIWQAPQNEGIVENNTIVGNISSSSGGGIVISVTDGTTVPVVRNNIVWGNRQTTGGQIDNPQYITGYNDVEDYSSGTNVSSYPRLEEGSFLLSATSPCIDAGDPALRYNDIADPGNPGMALPPSKGTSRNDIGAHGGFSAKRLPLLEISDLRMSGDTVNLKCPPRQQATCILEVLNTSSKSTKIDSITHKSQSCFTLNEDRTGRMLGLFGADSMIVAFTSNVRGIFCDTINIYHRIDGKTNPMKVAITALANCTPYLKNPIPPQSATVGQLFRFQIPDSTFADGDLGDTLAYQATDLPSWLSFESKTWTFHGIPTAPTGRTPIALGITAKDLLQSSAFTNLAISVQAATDVDDLQTGPMEYQLRQNYPNPFNPSTTINYQVKYSGIVKLRVFDCLGREVATLVDGQIGTGEHRVTFDAARFSSGIYFYKIQTGNFTAVKKMLLAK